MPLATATENGHRHTMSKRTQQQISFRSNKHDEYIGCRFCNVLVCSMSWCMVLVCQWIDLSALPMHVCVCVHKAKCLSCVRTKSVGRVRIPIWCFGVLQQVNACVGVTCIIVVVDIAVACVCCRRCRRYGRLRSPKVAQTVKQSDTAMHSASNSSETTARASSISFVCIVCIVCTGNM